MTDKEKDSKHVKASDLSKKSQEKLEEIKKKQGFKTTDEAIDYLTGFLKK
ncbi:hypothetical protein JMJ99_07945 [Companilactobacillus zhachilii]|nr:hypothetical protein [Companilactobacillus zhachilii]MBL3531299.1 hypothetical protein [Companilactobacillus zhachilii]